MQKKSKQPLSLLGLYRQTLKHKQGVILVILLQILWSILTLIFPFLTQILVDQGINYEDIDMIQLVLLAMFMLFIGSVAADFFKDWLIRHIGVRMNMDLVNNYLDHLIARGIYYLGNAKEGEILQAYNENYKIEIFLTKYTTDLFNLIFRFLLFGVLLFVFDLQVGLIFMGSLVLLFVWTLSFLPQRAGLDELRFGVQANSRSQLIELFNGIADIKVNNLEYDQMNRWYEVQDQFSMARLKLLQVSQKVKGGAYFINYAKDVFILYFTALAVVDGTITLGTMLAIQYVLGQLNRPMMDFSMIIGQWLDAKLSLNRINEFSGDEAEEYLPPESFPRRDYFGEVRIDRLAYEYADGKQALKDISLNMPYGQKIAIVGESGSGKSTFIKILLKLLPYRRGTINIGDRDLRSLESKSWRKGLSTVLQEGYVFQGSIKYNITLEEEDQKIDYQLVTEAIKVACLEEVIYDLSDGLETRLGKGGQGLSKGQAQRVLVARAVYKNSNYLIMDEPTSALDNMTSRNVIKNISRFFDGKSIIVATHKLPIAEYFDYVFMFRNGQIIEHGTHTDLMDRKSDYFELYNSFLKIQ